MNIQTTACFKKEILSFFRTGRIYIIALVILGLAVVSPVLYSGLGYVMDSMEDVYAQMEMDVSVMTQMLTANSSMGVSSTVSDITGVGLIVFLLLINRSAGGEQKKRDVIIPRSSGLRSFSYLFPKYIIYPLTAFALSVLAMLISYSISSSVFNTNDVLLSHALLAGVIVGIYMIFYVCFHITLGTATGMAGMSAAVCIGSSMILSNIFTFTDADYMYNPFALNAMAASVVMSEELTAGDINDIVITLAFSFALIILSFFIALFAQKAKQIDNTGNELEL